MVLACKCLNIIIAIRKDSQSTGRINVTFSDVEKENGFFKESELQIISMNEITRKQELLVETQSVGSWIIHRCLNCSMYTHATHKDKEGLVALNKLLSSMNDSELKSLESCEDYSDVFHILLIDRHGQTGLDRERGYANDVTCKNTMDVLQRHLMGKIRQESQKTEEKIREFTEEQYSLLEEYKMRAHDDYDAIIRILRLRHAGENVENGESTRKTRESNSFLDSVETEEGKNTIKFPQIRKQRKTSERDDYLHMPASFDTEGLFPLEGLEENIVEDDELSDCDDSGSNDEGIHIPRQKQSVTAKSLPIRVPASFESSFHWFDETMKYENKSEINGDQRTDIAASIKALANSVHGETIFGDLPPPRFSTHI